MDMKFGIYWLTLCGVTTSSPIKGTMNKTGACDSPAPSVHDVNL